MVPSWLKFQLYGVLFSIWFGLLVFLIAVAKPDDAGDWAEWRIGLIMGLAVWPAAAFIAWIIQADTDTY